MRGKRKKKAPAPKVALLGTTDRKEQQRRRLFVGYYVKYGRNGKLAAEKAGFAAGDSAKVQASRLLDVPEVKEAIDNETAFQLERVRDDNERLKLEYRRMAYVNLEDFLEVRTVRNGKSITQDLYLKADALDQLSRHDTAAIAELEQTKDGIRVKLHKKIDAMRDLARMNGLFQMPSAGVPLVPDNLSPEQMREQFMQLIKDGIRQAKAKERQTA